MLDSNFWLSTHVIAIIIGYARLCFSGLLAVYALIIHTRQGPGEIQMKEIQSIIMHLFAGGLFFTLLGTLLGGIWADQSWGHFWGWDPKENGALVIVLGCSILYHARLCGWVHRIGFLAGVAFVIQVVMLAWLGVNLLGTGLHSYGFTEGAAKQFLTYNIISTILITILLLLGIRKGHRF